MLDEARLQSVSYFSDKALYLKAGAKFIIIGASLLVLLGGRSFMLFIFISLIVPLKSAESSL